MNKFIKGCLYVAGILAAVGLVFFVLGAVFGGLRQTYELGRRGGLNYGSITPNGIHFSVGSDDIDIGDFEYEDEIEDANLIDYEEEALGMADEIDEIEISLEAGELLIQESEDSNYKMEADNTYNLRCYKQGSVLIIRGKAWSNEYAGIKKQRVVLYIPKDEAPDSVEIELGAGTGQILGLKTEDLMAEVGAGELKGSDIIAGNADIQVSAGAVNLRDCSFGTAEYEVGMGTIYYQGELKEDVSISCDMGNVELDVQGSEADFDYQVECAMGSITIGGRQFAAVAGEKRIDNSAAKTMDVDCDLGGIVIEFED